MRLRVKIIRETNQTGLSNRILDALSNYHKEIKICTFYLEIRIRS